MLIEKEVIRPGTYWYTDQETGLPRKLVVTPELTRYWHEQGNAMLSSGLTIPVPCEHDFNAHPMTPADKLLNNAGWVKEYRMRGDRLFSALDIPDPKVKDKLPGTIRWTSPWINTFTDGKGKEWKNVISHLALTTRPRIVEQEPFGSVAAALSMATPVYASGAEPNGRGLDLRGLDQSKEGFCLSNAGRLFVGKKTKRLRPRYPIAFSMWTGIKLAEDDLPDEPKKKPKKTKDKPPGPGADDSGGDDDVDAGADDFGGDLPDEEMAAPAPPEPGAGADVPGSPTPVPGMQMPGATPAPTPGATPPSPLGDPGGDVTMEELLCDLLNALGVHMPENVGEAEFKRTLYDATMAKIKELASKGMGGGMMDPTTQLNKDANNAAANTTSPAGGAGGNPILQQEQQPMYMSLEQINTLPDPLKGVALAMYQENQKMRLELESSNKTTNSLRDAKLKEAGAARQTRVNMLGRISPKVKADLDAMLALPSMALSMGDGGVVVDPMAQTLAVLEKGLSDMPRLLTTDASALSVQSQPTDASEMTAERADVIADGLSRMMGCPPKKAG